MEEELRSKTCTYFFVDRELVRQMKPGTTCTERRSKVPGVGIKSTIR